jgi:hypothetical protein
VTLEAFPRESLPAARFVFLTADSDNVIDELEADKVRRNAV